MRGILSTEIEQRYVSGLPMRVIGRQLNISYSTVRKRLHEASIKIRPASCGIPSRRLSLNENIFEELDCESSYWIGMLLADGCIFFMKNQNSYKVSYSSKDKEHIEKFKSFIGSGHKIIKDIIKYILDIILFFPQKRFMIT